MGTAKKSRSWHGNLKDTDPEVENENGKFSIIPRKRRALIKSINISKSMLFFST